MPKQSTISDIVSSFLFFVHSVIFYICLTLFHFIRLSLVSSHRRCSLRLVVVAIFIFIPPLSSSRHTCPRAIHSIYTATHPSIYQKVHHFDTNGSSKLRVHNILVDLAWTSSSRDAGAKHKYGEFHPFISRKRCILALSLFSAIHRCQAKPTHRALVKRNRASTTHHTN